MRRALPWLLGVALAVAAGAITVATPSVEALRDPFLVRDRFDPDAGTHSPVSARALTAVVNDAAFAERIADGDWYADGTWLVITVAASAPRSELDAELGLAQLRIGDEVFHASERPRDSLLDENLRVGIDTTGMLAFELPAGPVGGEAELRLSASYLTPRLDQMVAITIPLDELPTEPLIEIEPAEVGS